MERGGNGGGSLESFRREFTVELFGLDSDHSDSLELDSLGFLAQTF